MKIAIFLTLKLLLDVFILTTAACLIEIFVEDVLSKKYKLQGSQEHKLIIAFKMLLAILYCLITLVICKKLDFNALRFAALSAYGLLIIYLQR